MASTRGQVSGLGFSDALLMGLASDNGLLVPETIPDVRSRLGAWQRPQFCRARSRDHATVH